MPKPETKGLVFGFMLKLEVNMATSNDVPSPQLPGAPATCMKEIQPALTLARTSSTAHPTAHVSPGLLLLLLVSPWGMH